MSKFIQQHRFLKLFLIYVAAIVVGVVIAVISDDNSKIYATVFYLVIIAGLIIYMKGEQLSLKIWIRKPESVGIKPTAVMSVIILLMIIFTIAIRTAIWKEGVTESFEFDVYVFIGTGLLAPVIEEILCRGIIVDILKEKHSNVFVIIVSSVIFYIIHGNPMNVGALVFGILASRTVLKSKSIVPGIIMHFVWNNSIYFLPVIAAYLSQMS